MDESTFEQLAMAELDAVYRLACHLSHGTQEAEDFVQETYLRAFRSYATFRLSDHGIRPWLFKILHNVIYNRGAADQRDKQLIDELQNEAHGLTTPGQDGGGADLCGIDWDTVDERLKAAVEALPPANRVAFLLSVAEGLKYREISEVTDVPVGTVMSRLYRAREMLAEALRDLALEHRLRNPHGRSAGAGEGDGDGD